MRSERYQYALFFGLFFAFAAGLAWRSGAFVSDLSADPDEPAHYVSGLMVRQWVASGFPAPLEFAEQYYRHYPKVAVGHWPPLFYCVQAAWTLVFSPSRVSVLLLMAALAALLATDLFTWLRGQISSGVGAAAALFFLTLPAVQESSRAIMTELLTAWLMFRAALSCASYLDDPGWRKAAGFGLWSALALLTKGSAIVLAVVPVAGVALTRRYALLKTWPFWLPAVLVVGLCAPWYLWAPGAQHDAVAHLGRPRFSHWRVAGMASDWNHVVPYYLWPLILAGIVSRVAGPWRAGPVEAGWAAATGLAAGVVLGRSSFVAWETRHFLYALPVAISLAAAGARRIAGSPWLARVLIAMCVVLSGMNIYSMPEKVSRGYDAAARTVLSQARPAVILVCANATGEGAFIAEVAMREPAPRHLVIRGNKLLARVSWQGDRYELLARTPEETARRIEEAGVRWLVFDPPGPAMRPHLRLVQEMLDRSPDRWRRVGGGRVQLYRRWGINYGISHNTVTK